MAPRTKKWPKWTDNFRSGKSTKIAALGPLGTTTTTDSPNHPDRLVQIKRVEGSGRVKISGVSAQSLTTDLQDSADAIGRERDADVKKKGKLAKGVAWAKLAAQHTASVLALHRGPTSQPADAVALYVPTGPKAPGRNAEESPMLALTMDYLASTAAGDRAKATLDLAAQVELPEGERLELGDIAARIEEERAEVRRAAHERAVEINRQAVTDLVAPFPHELQTRARDAANALFGRLGAKTEMPDPVPAGAPNVLSAKVLTETAKHAFGEDHQALTLALEGLRDISPAEVGERISQVSASMEGLQPDGRLDDPPLQLAAALSRLTSGPGMLVQLMPVPAGTAAEKTRHGEALRVAASALSALQTARKQGDVDPGQQRWLSRAAAHASGVLANDAGPVLSAAERRHRHIAFRGVQSGFTSDGPDSAYAKVNSRLSDFSTGGMEQTQQRNTRGARSRLGRLKNWATGGLPKSLDGWTGLVPSALRSVGTQPTVWRKSVMRQLTTSAVANRMLPSRHEAVVGLHLATVEVRAALLARGGNSTPAETMMLRVLEALDLGAGQPVGERSLKKLGSAFFTQVEAGLPGGVEGLDPELAAAWKGLRGTHPNAGHLLNLLSSRIDMRSLFDGTPSDPQQVNLGQVANGARSDRLGRQAVAAFADLAPALRAATQALRAVSPPPGEIVPEEEQPGALDPEPVVSLLQATADILAAVQPPAALGALRIDTFEAIENRLTRELRDAAPADARPTWDEAKDIVKNSWPETVKAAWNDMKTSGDDASRLMRMLVDETIPLVPNQPAGPPTQADAAAAVPTVRDAILRATAPLQALQRDVHANRFELAVADTVTLFNDLRSARDAGAVMTSLSQRVSLGERFKSTDARQGNLDIGKAVSLPLTFQEIISPLLGVGIGRERMMELNMNGAGMQLWIGKTAATNASIGLVARVRGEIGNEDHEFNIGEDRQEAGVALRFDLRAELGGEWSSTQGVSLRLERTSGHEDQLRRAFGDVLTDLARPRLGVAGEGADGEDAEPYANVLASLLDRHPDLAVADMSNDRSGRTSEFGAMANAMVRIKGALDVPEDAPEESHEAAEDLRTARRRAAGVGAALGVASKVQRQQAVQTESPSRLNVSEFKRMEQHRVEGRIGTLAPAAMLPADAQQPELNPQVRAGQLEYRKQFYNTGIETTMRLVERNGETWAPQTQMIREYENFNDFLADVEPRQHQFVAMLAGRDNVPGASAAEKAGRAWVRMSDTLQQARASADSSVGANMVHLMATKLRPEAGQACDGLEALARLADEAGRPEDAAQHRAEIGALLKNDNTWEANNLQFKTKSKGEKAQTVTLGIGQGKAAGETTRLHEFVPVTAALVGKSPNKPVAVPSNHSTRWAPNLPPLEPPVEPRLPVKPGSLAELFQQQPTPDRVESDLYPPTPEQPAAFATFEAAGQQHETEDLYSPTSDELAASAAFEAAGQQHETGDLYPLTSEELAASAAFFEARRPPPLSGLVQSLDAQVRADQAAMKARFPSDIPIIEPLAGLTPEEEDRISEAEIYVEPSITRTDRS